MCWPESFLDNPWTQRLLELTEVLATHAAGRYLRSHAHAGALRHSSALRGGARFVMDLVDEPAVAQEAIDQGVTIRGATAAGSGADSQSDAGYFAVAALRAWAAEKLLWLQEDAMALLSPRLYAEHFLLVDRRLSDSFPCVAFHLHGSVLWAIDHLVESPGLGVIELNLEDARCDVQGTFAGWREIERRNRSSCGECTAPTFRRG